MRCEIYSATSYGELRREAPATVATASTPPRRFKPTWNRSLNLPTVAVSDNMAAVPDMIRQWVSGPYNSEPTASDGPIPERLFDASSKLTVPLPGAVVALREGQLDAKVYAKAEKNFACQGRDDIASL